MTSINNSGLGENLLVTLNSANSYSYTSQLIPPITNKKFVRFICNLEAIIDVNFVKNSYIYNFTTPTQLAWKKTIVAGKDSVWYECDDYISQVVFAVNSNNTFTLGESINIVCEFIDYVPANYQFD